MNGRQLLALATGDQRAFTHGRAANATADRRQHLGVTHINARLIQRGLGLQASGASLVVLLLTDGVLLDQDAVALGQRTRGDAAGLCALERRLIDVVIDLIELLPFFDFCAFFKQALLQDAVDLRTHFGHAVGRSTARQVVGQQKMLGLERHHAHGRSLLLLLLLLGLLLRLLTGTEQQGGDKEREQRDARGLHRHGETSWGNRL